MAVMSEPLAPRRLGVDGLMVHGRAMSLKTRLAPLIAARLMSEGRQDRLRAKAERKRRKGGAPHRLDVFHDPSDPYSQLLLSVLPALRSRYDVVIDIHRVGPPGPGAAPQPDRLAAYAATDAARLADRAGLPRPVTEDPATGTAVADALLDRLGHYQGGMIHYGGEWYWGLDRLHHLETRLQSLGVLKSGAAGDVIYDPAQAPIGHGDSGGEPLHWFFSFRSPYSAVIAPSVFALADAYNADLRLRFVLPMVMRGLPIPPAKRRYIPLDAAREARRIGTPYGRICDPVGRPVERGYALLHHAMRKGRGEAFVASFYRHVWAEGVDAGTDRGLRRIAGGAGFDWSEAKAALRDDSWRDVAEANRGELLAMGLWGVPSFRVGDTVVWGQDRLWAVEEALAGRAAERA